jgi:hypothetical protein
MAFAARINGPHDTIYAQGYETGMHRSAGVLLPLMQLMHLMVLPPHCPAAHNLPRAEPANTVVSMVSIGCAAAAAAVSASTRRAVVGPFTDKAQYSRLALHHYAVKSEEDFKDKTARGDVMGDAEKDLTELWDRVEQG